MHTTGVVKVVIRKQHGCRNGGDIKAYGGSTSGRTITTTGVATDGVTVLLEFRSTIGS